MPINPAIAMGVRGIELQDPLAQYGRVAAIQQAQQQNLLAQQQLQEYGRARQEEQEIRNRLAGGQSFESPEMRNFLLGSSTGRSMLKSISEQQEAGYKAAGARLNAVRSQLDIQRDLLARVNPESPDAVQQLMAIHQNSHRGDLGRQLADMGIDPERGTAEIAALQTPDQVRSYLTRAIQGANAFSSKLIEVSPGATLFDPMARKSVFTAPATPAKPTPAETEEIVLRLQDPSLTPALRKALESRLEILTKREPKEQKDDPTKVIAQTITDSAGNVTLLNKFGQVITPTTAGGASAPVKGKPSATFEKTTAQRKQLGLDLDRTITELTDITKPGGLISQSTGSGIGRAVDVGYGLFGQTTSGAIAAGKLAPISDMVLKMVPRFEGPQSDKDTRSYKEAAGQLADPTLPTELRRQAGLEILRLMKDRKNQFVSSEMAAEGIAPGATPAPRADSNFPAPPAAAIDALKRGVGTDAQFDAMFGPGAAARARGR